MNGLPFLALVLFSILETIVETLLRTPSYGPSRRFSEDGK